MVERTGAPACAGFIWQLRRALLTMLRDRSLKALGFETIDDICCLSVGGECTAAIQCKHSLDEGELLVSSEALWKTIHVWGRLVLNSKADSISRFVLACTMNVPDGSPLQKLINPETIDNKAQRQLIAEFSRYQRESTSDSTNSGRTTWKKLSSNQRLSLVRRMSILPSQAALRAISTEIDFEIENMLVRKEHVKSIADSTEGWLIRTVSERLSKSGCQITRDELLDYMRAHAEIYRGRTPVPRNARTPTKTLDEERRREPLYLQQLAPLHLQDSLLARAVEDLHRALADRSEWMQDQFVTEDQLKDLDCSLIRHWEELRDQSTLRKSHSEEIERARSVYFDSTGYSVSFAGTMLQGYVVAGMFHSLAGIPVVYWHADFSGQIKTNAA